MSARFEVVVTRSGAPAMRDRESGEIMHPLVGFGTELELLRRLTDETNKDDVDIDANLIDELVDVGDEYHGALELVERLGDDREVAEVDMVGGLIHC